MPRAIPLTQQETTARHRTAEVMAYPGIYEYRDILEPLTSHPAVVGACREFPPDFLFAQRACAGFYRSAGKLCATLAHDDQLYQAVRNSYTALTGRTVPRNPPTVNQLEGFTRLLASDTTAMAAVLRRFIAVEVAHARLHGNLLPGGEPDWASVDVRHLVLGDGMVILPYSDVRWLTDPDDPGQLLLLSSRARSVDAARRQLVSRQRGADGKGQGGINFMSLYTWTKHGTVVLAVDWTLGGEAPRLMEMIAVLAEVVGDGIHILAYDRVLEPGRLENFLIAVLGIQPLRKAKGRPLGNGEYSAKKLVALEVEARLRMRLHRAPTADELSAMVSRRAAELCREGRLEPGLSIYPTSTDGYDIVDSRYFRFSEPHAGGVGPRHRDHFVVDDMALCLLDSEGRKVPCQTESANRERNAEGTWARRTRWQVPCPHGSWVLERLFAPKIWNSTRIWGASGERIVAHMDPIPRSSAAFVGWRSIAESSNQRVENTTQHHGRAAHLHANVQMLDHLGANLAINASTWQQHEDAYRPWSSL